MADVIIQQIPGVDALQYFGIFSKGSRFESQIKYNTCMLSLTPQVIVDDRLKEMFHLLHIDSTELSDRAIPI